MGRKLVRKFQAISVTLAVTFLISQPIDAYAVIKSTNKTQLKMADNLEKTWADVMNSTDKAKSSTKKKLTELKGKVYKWVKNKWWTASSSGGYDVKFSKTKVKYYNREDGKIHHIAKINSYKKINGGYVIKVKNGQYKYCYTIYENQKDALEFYNGWKVDVDQYSGSSSLNKGKWQ